MNTHGICAKTIETQKQRVRGHRRERVKNGTKTVNGCVCVSVRIANVFVMSDDYDDVDKEAISQYKHAAAPFNIFHSYTASNDERCEPKKKTNLA